MYEVTYYIYIIIILLNYGCKSWQWKHLQSRAPECQLFTFPSVPYFPTFLIPFSFYHSYSILVFFIKDHGNQWMQVILFSLFIKCAYNLNISCMVNWKMWYFPPKTRTVHSAIKTTNWKLQSWLSRHSCWPKQKSLETTGN